MQSHVETLWRLLRRYEIPTFLFINKMDQPGTDREALMAGLKARLDDGCVDFGEDRSREAWLEELAMCDEELMEQYLEDGGVEAEDISRLIAERKVFPCYFGSALKTKGWTSCWKESGATPACRNIRKPSGRKYTKSAGTPRVRG